MSSTGIERDARLRQRAAVPAVVTPVEKAPADGAVPTTTKPVDDGDRSLFRSWEPVEAVIGPLFFTLLGAFVRLYRIGAADRVVWDEAHFGKFGSFYLKHTYYFDVHPPLGKMLCGLSGWVAGYNGTFGFESGQKYPEYLRYEVMREFNAMFSILAVPLAYFTAKGLKLSLPGVWILSLLVALELSFATLARFILLDSMLLLFTVGTFFSLVKFHNTQRRPFSFWWWFWLTATGLNIGLTTSVKMVGLFVMALVGVYTIVDLWVRWGHRTVSLVKYGFHWIARVLALLIVPGLIFAAAFKIHFLLLTKTGDGLASMSSLFQANLEDSDISGGPLDIAYGSRVTFKHQGISGGLLHSHIQTFPEGSKQQQVTTYAHNDANNEWVIEYPRWEEAYNDNQAIRKITDGDVVRLVHYNTGRNLHSHDVRAPMQKGSKEVSCYGNSTVGDEKDNWIVEIAETLGSENKSTIHPLTTSIRLRHQSLGCYLAAEGNQLPEWGFRQGEVSCMPNVSKRNKKIWWNVDTHHNHRLPDAFNRTMPKSKFMRDFIQLNFAQMASNNALVPDPDKVDDLSSQWWEWPIVRRGLRMCSWGENEERYFLFSLPSTAWLTTLAVAIFVVLTGVYILRWQRGFEDFTSQQLEQYAVAGIVPFLGWFFHYFPFIIMSRVTYFHHYMPALYFAIFVLVFLIDTQTKGTVQASLYGALFSITVAFFYYFSPLALGMNGKPGDFDYMQWFSTWRMGA